MDDSPSQLSQVFYRNTRIACKALGIKIGDLEAEIGLPSGHLSRWRKKGMRLWTAYKVSQALEIPIDLMLSEKGENLKEVIE